MDLSLNGKRALVCGSTRGIGRACAVELAALGASVILMARNEDLLIEAREALPRPGGARQKHAILVADFTDTLQVRAAVEAFVDSGGRAEILINNTGGPPPGRAIDAPAEEFLAAFQSHLVNNHTLTRALVPGMRDARWGRIVNIISTSVRQPIPNLGVSNTVRGAVASWSKTLSLELAADGITVNNVLPGYTMTDRLDALIQGRAKKAGKPPEEIANAMRAEVPAQRFAEPHEVAAAAAFLCTPAAGYINGVSLAVDGGRTTAL
jgi:3-oxoacyl-[acyl-carrier protein] reductase